MEMPVDLSGSQCSEGIATLRMRLLGPVTVLRDGIPAIMPASRKVRALLAYLALAPHAVPRSQLCELLWDVPNDPRGELRWCLSKTRGIVDSPARRRVETSAQTIRLDLAGCRVDALEVVAAEKDGFATLPLERLRELADSFLGEFLEGSEVERSPAFSGWLIAQRRFFRDCHATILEQLARRAPGDEVLGHIGGWLQLAPFDPRPHEALLTALAQRGRVREAEEHLATSAQLFEAEGLDHAPIRNLWRSARAQKPCATRARAEVQIQRVVPGATPAPADEASRKVEPRRASIAIMPFADSTGVNGGLGDGLAHDVITRLAKLRSLFVIAQGTVFALRERNVGPEEAGRMLNVDYVVAGTLRRQDARIVVTTELTDTRTARLVWSETFDQKADDAFLMLDEIGNRIVASIASEVETIERNRAILRPPSSLDAWEAHHRGLWHMYRFTREDNDQARHFFETALRQDPTFSRAHAGLSSIHFQNAFQGWADHATETDHAFEAAGQAVMADDRDPAAHWAMGRALWLRGHHDKSLAELSTAIDLSPNFAIGHYALAFVHSQAGDPRFAITASDHSRHLSPFDPLLFAMLGARAMALVRLERFDEAADWGVKAAARPNAHPHILAIATYCLALAGRHEEAAAHWASLQKRRQGYGIEDFLRAMQFSPIDAARFRKAAKRVRR